MDGFKRRLSESVQLRLSITLSLAILIVALAAGVFAFVSALDEAHEMQDEGLRQVAILFDRQQMTLHYPSAEQSNDDEDSRITVQYLADSSKAITGDDAAIPLPFPTTLTDGLSTANIAGEDFRVLVRTTARGERIVVAQEADVRNKEARERAWRSLLPFLILFPVLLLAVGDLVRKMFRPVSSLSAEINRRDEQALHPIDEQHVPSEIRPFVVAINQLLARVAQSMDTERRFVADAAHELRSPMTALSLQAQRLGATDMSLLARERLQPLSEGIERSRKLIDQLLTLASAQSGSTRRPTAVSVHAVYRQVLEDLLPLAERKHIDIGVEGVEDVKVVIHEMDLFTLVKNLVDNAIRYTPPGGRIDLSIERNDVTVTVQIRDTGPGIVEAERPKVFEPFYRSEMTEEPGSGLGLSIVKAIAARAGALVRLDYSDVSRKSGLCVSVVFTTPSR